MTIEQQTDLIARVRCAQKYQNIPWTGEAQAVHEGLTPEALADAVQYWENKAAVKRIEAKKAEDDLFDGGPCGAGKSCGGGRRVSPRKRIDETENHLQGDNNHDSCEANV